MEEDLSTTPLDALHRELGARMVPFAGYAMPLQYQLGIMKEHLHCRAAAGLFDVSHMGQIWIEGQDTAAALESLLPQSVVDLPFERQRYGFLTNDAGGIIDDLMFVRIDPSRVHIVANAANFATVLDHLRAGLPGYHVERFQDAALLALQGPKSEAALSRLLPGLSEMRFMDYAHIDSDFGTLRLTRSGYTGEDGFEISVDASHASALASALLEMDDVEPIGLGARDSLRLEAGLCLHGNDIDATTTPVEAALTWAIQKVRRAGGDREGGFPGAGPILSELTDGASRRRIGIKPDGRAPIRAGAPILDTVGNQIGQVTSGVFGPTIEGPVAMGYVATDHAKTGTELLIEVRGKQLPARAADLPFITPGYKR